jgi:hypothetical protein
MNTKMNSHLKINNKQDNFSKRSTEKVEDSQKKETPSANTFANGWKYNLGDINLSNKNGEHRFNVQPKLMIGKSNDKYEQEADSVAERIMQMPGPSLQNVITGKPTLPSFSPARQISRVVQNQEKDDEEIVQSKSISNFDQINQFSENGLSSLGNGKPMPKETRSFFETRFGNDFSNVRIFDSPKAGQMAKRFNAKAFTVGGNIVMGTGFYTPESIKGKHLLAHELTHTIQQRSMPMIQRKVEVNAGLSLDTKGYTTTKSGNIYTAPKILRSNGLFHEVLTGLLGSPRVFKLKGGTNSEVNKSFKEQRNARIGIISFASKKKYKFGAGANFKMNPKYWVVDAAGPRVKSGEDAQEAIDDLNINPKEYAIACLAATTLTMIGGGKSQLRNASGNPNDDWIPGDWGYITNTKFSGSARDVGLEGENIIYTGNNMYWGHFGSGNTYKTLAEWINDVKSWNGGATLESNRRFPNAGLE